VSRRPLVTVPALTLADLLLWHWSLTAPHEIVAIVAGLTLPPLLVTSIWLVGLAGVRLLARGVRVPLNRASRTSRTRAGRADTKRAGTRRAPGVGATATSAGPAAIPSTATLAGERPPRKLAA